MLKKISKNKLKIMQTPSHIFSYIFIFVSILFAISAPDTTFAAQTFSQDLFGLFEYAKAIINDIVLWLFTTGAVLCFIAYLAFQIFQLARNGKMDSNAKSYIFYGLITLTLMFTFYAVIGLIAVTFGIQIGIPQFFKNQDGLSPGSGQVRNSYSILGR